MTPRKELEAARYEQLKQRVAEGKGVWEFCGAVTDHGAHRHSFTRHPAEQRPQKYCHGWPHPESRENPERDAAISALRDEAIEDQLIGSALHKLQEGRFDAITHDEAAAVVKRWPK